MGNPELAHFLEQGGNYAVAGGHGGLVILDIDHDSALAYLDKLPETFTVKSGGKRLPHLYYLTDNAEQTCFSRKIPLTDEQVEQYAKLVLKEGTKVLATLELETLFDLRGKGGLAVGPNSRLDQNTVYEIQRDIPITRMASVKLCGLLETCGTTLRAEKDRIIALARKKSPEFNANMEERENRPEDPTAPWFLPQWKKIVETVGVSGVYEYMGEPFSLTGRNRCLLGHASKSGQTVMCTDNQHWHCFSCGESGDAWNLFKHIKGEDKANGQSTFYTISPEFAALAGDGYKAQWESVLSERRKAYKAEQAEKRTAQNAAAEAMLQEINQNHFVSTDANAVGIAKVEEDTNKQLYIRLLSERNFVTLYKNRKVTRLEYDPDQKKYVEKTRSLPKAWLEWEGRREHQKGTIFLPRPLSEEEARDYFNIWRGFQVKAIPGSWDKIRYHLFHIWCRDNESDFNYLMSWFAQLFQQPEIKPSVAVLVKGGKGSGKSIIMDHLLAPILGPAYCQLDKSEQVTGRFNAHHYGKLLMSLEEAVWAGAKDAEGALKTLISSPTFFLEGKGKDGKNVDSFSRIIFLSNERRAVPATHGERRFFALKTNDEKKGDQAYFSALLDEINNGGREAFFHALLEYEGLDIIGLQPPMTEALLEDIEEGMEPLYKWFYYLLDNHKAIYGSKPDAIDVEFSTYEDEKHEGYCVWGSCVSVADLQEQFQKWIEGNKKNNAYVGYSGINDRRVFSRELNKMFGDKDDKKKAKKKIDNHWHFRMPEIHPARQRFEEHIGRELPWNMMEINEADIFRDTGENREAVDLFWREYEKWTARVHAASVDKLQQIDPSSIPEPTFAEVEAALRAEKEEDADTFLKNKPKQ